MTTRTTTRALALLVGALVLAACGGSTATNAPGATQGGAATGAPATQAPAGTGGGEPSFALPSFHGAVDLEKLVPAEIGGEAITTLSMTGTEFVGSEADSELTAALASLDKQPSDLSVAFGSNSLVTIFAFQVDGASGSSILNALLAASESDTAPTVSDVSYGGKSVKKLVPVDPTDDTTYTYTVNDVVFAVGGTDVTDTVLNEVFSKLP